MEGQNVFVVDDEAGVRNSLSRLLAGASLPVQAFDSAQSFLTGLQPGQAGCLLLDVNMPGMSGLQLQSELRKRDILLPIIFLTGSADVSMAVAGMKGGAFDFLEKPIENDVLIARVRDALALDLERRQDDLAYRHTRARLSKLTPREREVLDLLVAGRANKMIAYLLGASVRTIEVHRGRVMEKMQAASVAELVRMILTLQAGQRSTSSDLALDQ